MLKKMLRRLMVVAAVVVAGFCAAPKEGGWQLVGQAPTSEGGKVSPGDSLASPGKFRRARVSRKAFRPAPADWLNFKTASQRASEAASVDGASEVDKA